MTVRKSLGLHLSHEAGQCSTSKILGAVTLGSSIIARYSHYGKRRQKCGKLWVMTDSR